MGATTNTNRVFQDLQDYGPSSITDLVNRLGLSRLDVVAVLLLLEQRQKIRTIVAQGKIEAL